MSNNPDKVRAVIKAGLEVVERVPLECKRLCRRISIFRRRRRRWDTCCSLTGISRPLRELRAPLPARREYRII
jgi:hypothetical protein